MPLSSKSQMRLDVLINKLIKVRNTVTEHYDVDFDIASELHAVEESVETLAQEVDSEEKDL